MENRLWKSLNFAQLQAINMALHNSTGAPATPVEWQIYMNTTTHLEYVFNGTSWINALDRTNHSGTQLANSISDFDTQVRTNRLDQMASPTSSVWMNSQKITWLATPTVATDAANKWYVDDLVNGTDWKASARVGTTGNITLSGLQTIDWVSVLAGERVLVKDQTTASENGIYAAGTGAWLRTEDANITGDLKASSCLFIQEWTVNKDSQWRITTDWVITIGVSDIVFTQIWAGTSYTAGNGIDITGSTIKVDTGVVTRKYATTIWNGSDTSFTITHWLGTLDIMVIVREISTGEQVIVPTDANSTTEAIIEFAVAPTTNQYRVIIQG